LRIVARVHAEDNIQLAHVALADSPAGFLLRAGEGRQKEGAQNRSDGNDHD